MSEQKKGVYENLKMKAAKGEYTLVDPLDYIILGFVEHEVGAMSMGLFPLGISAKGISRKFTPEQQKVMTSSAVSTRLRLLGQQDLVEKINSTIGRESASYVWQRTKSGTRLYKEWEARRNGSSGRGEANGSKS